MNETLDFFQYEDIREALRAAINALGGFKKVGCRLRPAMKPDQARAWLNNAIDPTRPEKLEIEDIVAILADARGIGFHGAMHQIDRDAGYEPAKPIEPVDERATLQRAFIESVKHQERIVARMERLTTAPLSVVDPSKKSAA